MCPRPHLGGRGQPRGRAARLNPAVETFEHPGLAFTIELPASARVTAELPPVFELEQSSEEGVETTISVSCEPVDDAIDLGEWVTRSLERQRRSYPGVLIDRHVAESPQGPVVHSLQCVPRDALVIAVDQWWSTQAGRGWVVTASCVDSRYAHVAPVARAAALSLDVSS